MIKRKEKKHSIWNSEGLDAISKSYKDHVNEVAGTN